MISVHGGPGEQPYFCVSECANHDSTTVFLGGGLLYIVGGAQIFIT